METFSRNWPFVRGIRRSPVNSPHKGQWRGALMFSLICAWINCRVNNCDAGDLRRHCAHYDVTVMNIACDSVSSLGAIAMEFGMDITGTLYLWDFLHHIWLKYAW